MVRLDLESDLAVDSGDQGVEHVRGDVDHGLTVGALQMGMRRRRDSIGRGQGEVVNRGRTRDVSMGDEAEFAECREGAIDRSPVNARSRCLGASDDLVRGQVLLGAVQYLDDGLASSGDPLMLIA